MDFPSFLNLLFHFLVDLATAWSEPVAIVALVASVAFFATKAHQTLTARAGNVTN